MKTKKILLLWMFIVIGALQIHAQPEGTKTVHLSWSGNDYFLPIYCEGVQVDYLEGNFTIHIRMHLADGIPTWYSSSVFGQATSSTGEVFRLKETDQKHMADQCFLTLNYNLKGDKGNHYLGTLTWDYCNDPYLHNPVVDKAACLENGPDKK